MLDLELSQAFSDETPQVRYKREQNEFDFLGWVG